MEHLIQRIYTDLRITDVCGGPQNTKELSGSISAAAMAETAHGYFAADTQAEAEKFLQEYYKKFNLPLTAQDLAGTYNCTVSISIAGKSASGSGACSITVSGDTVSITVTDSTLTGTFADCTVKGAF